MSSGTFSPQSIDDQLRELIESQKTRIKVIGAGGGGNNTICRLMETDASEFEAIAINTDVQDLLHTTAHKKLLIGKELTKGLGAGSKPHIGEQAARENSQEIKESILDTDLLFLTCGLGGGTGTGSIPVVAEIANKMGVLCVAIVTVPFEMEGSRRLSNALYGLERLYKWANTTIIIPNDKLLELVPDVPISTAFKVADEILINSLKSIIDLINKPGLVNLDYSDIKTLMTLYGGTAMIGVGESDSDNRAEDALEKAISNPLLDTDINGAQGALVNIYGGADFTLEETQKILSRVHQIMSPDAKIIWGAQILEDMSKSLRVMLIITGVDSNLDSFIKPQLGSLKQTNEGTSIGIDILSPKR